MHRVVVKKAKKPKKSSTELPRISEYAPIRTPAKRCLRIADTANCAASCAARSSYVARADAKLIDFGFASIFEPGQELVRWASQRFFSGF